MRKLYINKNRSATKKRKLSKSQTDIIELKKTIAVLKNSIESFNSRQDQREESISQLKDRSPEMIQPKEQQQKE